MAPGPILIKKYGNRRLYDTAASRYINLDDIAAMIRAGRDVTVVDARTSRDLTRVVLTQIITEDAKGQPTGLPLELLRQLIVASDQAGREFIMWYLKSAFDAYHKVQNAMQTRLNDMQSAVLSPVQTMRRFLGIPESGDAASPPHESEVDVLRRRIAELETRLAAAQPARPRKAQPKTAGRATRTAPVPVPERAISGSKPIALPPATSVARPRHADSRGRTRAESSVRHSKHRVAPAAARPQLKN